MDWKSKGVVSLKGHSLLSKLIMLTSVIEISES